MCRVIFVFAIFCHSAWALDTEDAMFSGQWVVTHQATDVAKNEQLYSLDIEVDYELGEAGFFSWAEYSKTPDGLSNDFFGANADAGTTQDSRGDGRWQISEAYVYHKPGRKQFWQLGLMQISALVDTSLIANDEVTQFLSAGQVNNLSIAFPDYAFGASYRESERWHNWGYALVLSQGQGLADREGNYSDLLNFDTQGAFAALEMINEGDDHTLGIGVWRNSAQDTQRGAYINMEYYWPGLTLNLRAGMASREPEAVTEFVAMTVNREFDWGEWALGYSWHAYKAAGENQILESYCQFPFGSASHISVNLQWHARQIEMDSDAWIYGLRWVTEF